ncbi:polyisoprenoid-binding protein [Caulobacter sp. SLTY]|uniref:YceI family protein n=1 Tax=Caulobacter sp. SLTY TaxID=2683262 RepID=UPI001412D712|nr:YceI family protein [Caulobacter sp. SLTY]NBB15948.1 polyisoprenoid-binding protein [Caulobacter sp. SLTY]
MRRLLAALAVLFLAALPAAAAPAPAWTVDKAASKIGFSSSFDGEGFNGAFARWDAQIRFDPANLAGSSAVVTIDTASVFTGNGDRDANLKEPKWFSSKAHPKAVYRTTGFKALGGGRYQATGTLTLRGQSKPLTLPFTLVITGDQAKMNARISLSRLAFGVGQDEWKKIDVIPDPVTVTVQVTARRAK